jgi:hypothetical protein
VSAFSPSISEVDAMTPMRFGNGEIINIDFAPLLLELRQFKGGERTRHLTAFHRDERNEGGDAEQPFHISGAPSRIIVGSGLPERLRE